MTTGTGGHAPYAVFALTRGYSGASKIRYGFVIRRNRALRRVLRDRTGIDFLLLHEGNIGALDQALIQALSGIAIRFIDVSEAFRPGPQHLPPEGTQRDIGYRLMCRFNYQQLWHYLNGYEVVCRVDEDCVVESLPDFDSVPIMLVGALDGEPHPETNETLPPLLADLGLGQFFDHQFPYTNCYMSRVAFWMREDVQSFLRTVGEHPLALKSRWGDLPMLGVALKAFGGWDAAASVDPQIQYFHQSHSARVAGGQMSPVPESPGMRLMHSMLRAGRRIAGVQR